MLRNASTRTGLPLSTILNEVLSLNAQEFSALYQGCPLSDFLNEVLSLNAQEYH